MPPAPRRRSSASRSRPTWASSRPAEGFLEHLRTLADRTDALLVLDEVISGFRVAPGGAQELLGVEADVTIMGKVIGGGLPAAAYGARRELMERVAPAGDVYQAGTLSGNPLAVAAGLTTLRLLDAAAYERLAALTARLADGMRGAIAAAGAEGRASVVDVPGAGHPVPRARGADRLRVGPGLRPRRLRPALPRPARARRLRAPLAVRSLVRLARPRRGGDRPHLRRARRGAGGGARVSEGTATVPAADALTSLARELRAEGSVISPHVRDPDPARSPASLGALAAAGPRVAAQAPLYAGVVESVREGYLLHYGDPRLVDPPDPDLALLAGDYLYAKGLGLLATTGDLDSVRALADLIAVSAELHADGDDRGNRRSDGRSVACHRRLDRARSLGRRS